MTFVCVITLAGLKLISLSVFTGSLGASGTHHGHGGSAGPGLVAGGSGVPHLPGDVQPGSSAAQASAVWPHRVPSVSGEAAGQHHQRRALSLLQQGLTHEQHHAAGRQPDRAEDHRLRLLLVPQHHAHVQVLQQPPAAPVLPRLRHGAV